MNVALRAEHLNVLSACAGAGGLDLGLRIAEPRTRTVCYIEREAYAAATLVARMEDEAMDRAPIWDDLKTFDGRAWRGCVDIVIGGIPCQGFSIAGDRKGVEDDRWLWPDFWRIVCETGARRIFLENVRGIVSASDGAAVAAILGDLADAGWDAEWGVFSAREVGARHVRERFYLLADAGSAGSQGRELRATCDASTGQCTHASAAERGGSSLADTARDGRERLEVPARSRREGKRATHACWSERGLPSTPPGPRDETGWRIVADAGYAHLEPAVCRVADGMAYRVDRLRLCGNGAHPLASANAYRTLSDRLFAHS